MISGIIHTVNYELADRIISELRFTDYRRTFIISSSEKIEI